MLARFCQQILSEEGERLSPADIAKVRVSNMMRETEP
jgi:hypothetical protein